MNYYNKNADNFIETTKICDMSVQYDLFLKYIKNGRILDVGFGSARDMLHFKSLGFDVFGIDIEPKFINRALDLGLNVENIKIEDIKYNNEFDGIWACASLLHCPNLIEALNKCYDALVKGGVMYLSFKYGDFKGVRTERFFIDLKEESFKEIISQTKFSFVDYIITNDVRPNRENEKWLNAIIIKEKE